MNVDISTIQQWTSSRYLSRNSNHYIQELCIDSRRIATPANALFFAIETTHRDGHNFIQQAYSKGVRNFIVSKEISYQSLIDCNILLVDNTINALQEIARQFKKQFDITSIAITGSNGKTIVKEWLHQLLADNYNVTRSPKSYNSQIGVPLSISLINHNTEIGIFEAGISQPGEMTLLEKIIDPSIGIFTNIGDAHSEGFKSKEEKISEKLKLFTNAKHLILNKDNSTVLDIVKKQLNGIELFTWSTIDKNTSLYIKGIDINQERGETTLLAEYAHDILSINIPFTDQASIENAIHCWAALILLKLPHTEVQAKFTHLHSVSMRLEMKHGINNCSFINDAYNSDFTSLTLAIQYLKQQVQYKEHTVILSDMQQISLSDEELYKKIASLIARNSISRFIGIGHKLNEYQSFFKDTHGGKAIFFNSTEDFVLNFDSLVFENEAILLKGARKFKFEKITSLFEQKVHQTVLSIDLAAITNNYRYFRRSIPSGVKIMAMVKAYSYGSGSYEIANTLQQLGIDYLGVAYTDEGITLRKAGITTPIMVMNPDIDAFNKMIAWQLEPELYNINSVKKFCTIAENLDRKAYPVHIKLDTGMNRLGFKIDEIDELISFIRGKDQVAITSIFSHLSASDSPEHDDFTQQQGKQFELASNLICKELAIAPLKHISNTSAIVRHPNLNYNMVRLGLGLYGTDSTSNINNSLEQAATLKTIITQIKYVLPGESIGYGHNVIVSERKRIATINIGYADGYTRALSKSDTYVLVNGQKAPLIGKVCMDMCMIDITGLTNIKEGDSVIVFGKDLPVAQLAKWADTIPYEILTNISQRVKRVYENEV